MKSLIVSFFLSVSALMAFTDNPKEEKQIQNLIKKVKPAFVFLPQGSGVLISPDGYLLTNAHVLTSSDKVFPVRLGNGKAAKARLIGQDPIGDLALLKISGENHPFVKMVDMKNVKIGEACIALGNPFAIGLADKTPTITLGVISGLHQANGDYTDAIVNDAPINPGNSGGPLINLQGELLGINGLIKPSLGLRSNTGLAYAIPANQIKLWLPLLKKAKGGDVYHSVLYGIEMESSEDFKGTGAKLKKVKEGSLAAD